jgi:L-amino acid N-acyltransferase YncA
VARLESPAVPLRSERAVVVRPATADDVDAIAEIHVSGYEDAYRGLIPDEVLAERTVELRRRVWAERLAQRRPREFVVVAEVAGHVAGFSSGRAATAEEGGEGERIGCWENLYLRPDVLGSADSLRIGLALHERTLAGLVDLGFSEAVNFVIDGNDRARQFFEAVGWKPDGHRVEADGVTRRRHRRPLPVEGRP